MTTNVLAEHNDEVWNVEWSPDGRYLASGGADRTVIIWHIGVCLAGFSRSHLPTVYYLSDTNPIRPANPLLLLWSSLPTVIASGWKRRKDMPRGASAAGT